MMQELEFYETREKQTDRRAAAGVFGHQGGHTNKKIETTQPNARRMGQRNDASCRSKMKANKSKKSQ